MQPHSVSNNKLRHRSYAALLSGAQAANANCEYDQSGYAPRWQDNVLNGIPLEAIIKDFSAGAGRELNTKLRAAHSSAALVVNTFAPWRTQPESLRIAGISGFRNLQFEMTFPTGLGGTPPHLDLFAHGDAIVAVESKCTEWMEPKLAIFSQSYDRLRSALSDSPWFEVMCELRENPGRYKFLDAAQLVKHAFGLAKRFGSEETRLVYLFWEPINHQEWPDCQRHRQDASELAEKTASSNVRFIPMSYHELWAEREAAEAPAHLSFLKTRYCQRVPPRYDSAPE